LKREKDAADAVAVAVGGGGDGDEGWRAGGWSRGEVVMELGSVLRAGDQLISSSQGSEPFYLVRVPVLIRHIFILLRSIQLPPHPSPA
jgi:hypothetical protein